MYKCHACGKQFIGGIRINSSLLWEEYQEGKQTLLQLSKRHKCSKRTVQRKLDLHQIEFNVLTAKEVVILLDTTYWGNNFGVMLFKDALSKQNLLKYYVKSETNHLYLQGVNELRKRGFIIKGIVCDGRRGLFNLFGNIPIQMCQFHQASIVRRYITKNPKLPASIELKEIVKLMHSTDKESFIGALNEWSEKWDSFLKERTINYETGKSHYTHKRLRSAYRSLKNNLFWLFTWYDYIELNIPNTTNALEGHFSDLKTKMRNHNGLTIHRKKKFIDGFLKV